MRKVLNGLNHVSKAWRSLMVVLILSVSSGAASFRVFEETQESVSRPALLFSSYLGGSGRELTADRLDLAIAADAMVILLGIRGERCGRSQRFEMPEDP